MIEKLKLIHPAMSDTDAREKINEIIEALNTEKAERCPEGESEKDYYPNTRHYEIGTGKIERCRWMSKTIDEIPNYRCMLPTHGKTIVYCPCNGMCGTGKLSTSGVKERDDMKPNYGEREV